MTKEEILIKLHNLMIDILTSKKNYKELANKAREGEIEYPETFYQGCEYALRDFEGTVQHLINEIESEDKK